MKLEEALKDIPKNRFRVIGRDNFDTPRDEQYFIVDDYEQQHEAVAIARLKTKEEHKAEGAEDIATTFYVINDKKLMLYPEIKEIIV